MVDRTSGLQYQTGQGYSALDAQAARDRLDGFSVVSGLGVSPGGSLSVDVAAGEALVGGTTVSPGSVQNVSLTAADSTNPRKDTIYIDDTGTAQVETGAAETPLPEGNARFNTFQPEPPRPGTDGTILAEVWVAAGASSLSSADVRDRRQPADVVGEAATFDSVSTEQEIITDGTNDESTEIIGTLSDADDTTVVDESLSFTGVDKVVIEGFAYVPSDIGSFALQINGVTGSSYRYQRAGSDTQDDTKAPIGPTDFNRAHFFRIVILTADTKSARPGFKIWIGNQDAPVTGYVDNLSTSIDSVRIFEDTGSNSTLSETIIKGTNRQIP